MAIEPIWSRKPKHKQTVVATSRGWEVEKTGELLVSVRNLDQKIKELYSSPTAIDQITPVTPTAIDEVGSNESKETIIIPNAVIVETPIVDAEVTNDQIKEVIPSVDTDVKLILEPTLVENTIVVKEDSNDEKVIENILDLKDDESVDEEIDLDTPPEVIVVPPQAEIVAGEPVVVKKKPGRPKKVVVAKE